MIIQINRYRYKANSIDGHLFIDGMKVCDTTERFGFNIPSGTYSVTIAKCPIGARNIPVINLNEVHSTPCTKCIKTHTQNTNICLKPWKAIDRIIQKGIDSGEPEEEYLAKARAKEIEIDTKKAAGDKRFIKRPMPKCPRLAIGNGVFRLTDHSILVGTYLQPGIVTHSKLAFDNLYDRIRKNVERGNKVLLIID